MAMQHAFDFHLLQVALLISWIGVRNLLMHRYDALWPEKGHIANEEVLSVSCKNHIPMPIPAKDNYRCCKMWK